MAVAEAVRWRVRPMQEEDIESVIAIDRESFSLPWSRRSYEYELLENPIAQLFVAERIAPPPVQIIGYLGVWELRDEGHISTVAVTGDQRRKGVAEDLLRHALEYLGQRGIRAVTLEVRRSNQAAQNLYEKYGFAVVGERRGYYRDDGEDALLMTLNPLKPLDSKASD